MLKKNIAFISGTIKTVEVTTEINGRPFNGYQAKVETRRLSGEIDEVVIAFASDAVDCFVEDRERYIKDSLVPGNSIYVKGCLQCIKNPQTRKVLLIVLAREVRMEPENVREEFADTNKVIVSGDLAFTPKLRKTPKGRIITDFVLGVDHVLRGYVKSYLHGITWGNTAYYMAQFEKGEEVQVEGRIQSREFPQLINKDTEEKEIRTWYEISVYRIKGKPQNPKKFNQIPIMLQKNSVKNDNLEGSLVIKEVGQPIIA